MLVLWIHQDYQGSSENLGVKFGDWRHDLLSVETLQEVFPHLSFFEEDEEKVLKNLKESGKSELVNGSSIRYNGRGSIFVNDNDGKRWVVQLREWSDFKTEKDRVLKMSREELQMELIRLLAEQNPSIDPSRK